LYKKVIKPILDCIIAAIILCFALLPGMLIALILRIIQGKNGVFFTQLRPGKDEEVFRLLKFKTMNDKCDAQGNLLPDEKRLTAIGRFIRKTSLDELPQLFNVLCGQMSLVGPRPLLVEYLPIYNAIQCRRHEVKPGITGWAQVNGRNAISWQQKFELDVWYVDHCSFLLDFRILLLTLKKVVVREGINAQGAATAEYFSGNN